MDQRNDPGQGHIILGPLVGHTTETTTNIIIVTNADAEVFVRLVKTKRTISLNPADEEPMIDYQSDKPGHRTSRKQRGTRYDRGWIRMFTTGYLPTAVTISNLAPESEYIIECSLPFAPEIKTTPRVVTRCASSWRFEKKPVNIIFVGGPPNVTETPSSQTAQLPLAWEDIHSRISEIDLIIFTGSVIDTTRPHPCVESVIKELVGADDVGPGIPTWWNLTRWLLERKSYSIVLPIVERVLLEMWVKALSAVSGVLSVCSSLIFLNESETGALKPKKVCNRSRNVRQLSSGWQGEDPTRISAATFSSQPDSEQEEGAGSSSAVSAADGKLPTTNRLIASIAYRIARLFMGAFNGDITYTRSYILGPVGISNIDLKLSPFFESGSGINLANLIQQLEPGALFEHCSLMIVVVQEPISEENSLWHLVPVARRCLVESLLEWREQKHVGEREILIISHPLRFRPVGGANDIIARNYQSWLSTYIRQEFPNKEAYDIPFRFLPRNRVREIVVPYTISYVDYAESKADSKTWSTPDLLVHNFRGTRRAGYLEISGTCDYVRPNVETSALLMPSRLSSVRKVKGRGGGYYVDYVYFRSRFHLDKGKGMIEKQRTVNSYEFNGGKDLVTEDVQFPMSATRRESDFQAGFTQPGSYMPGGYEDSRATEQTCTGNLTMTNTSSPESCPYSTIRFRNADSAGTPKLRISSEVLGKCSIMSCDGVESVSSSGHLPLGYGSPRSVEFVPGKKHTISSFQKAVKRWLADANAKRPDPQLKRSRIRNRVPCSKPRVPLPFSRFVDPHLPNSPGTDKWDAKETDAP